MNSYFSLGIVFTLLSKSYNTYVENKKFFEEKNFTSINEKIFFSNAINKYIINQWMSNEFIARKRESYYFIII